MCDLLGDGFRGDTEPGVIRHADSLIVPGKDAVPLLPISIFHERFAIQLDYVHLLLYIPRDL